jgi:hypothetical protein
MHVVNKSTLVSDADVKTMARAVAHQMRYHACPAWGLLPEGITFVASEAGLPAGSIIIAILDDPNQAGALGWHTEDANDVIHGVVFARPILDNGGDILSADLSVASVLSHEALETLVDRHANLWADDGQGTAYALEVGDAVESDSYDIFVDGQKVTVSNFVLPSWFDPMASPGTKCDFLGKTTSPFEMTKGGYVVTMQDGNVAQKFGETFPDWRKDTVLSGRPDSTDNKSRT